MTMSDWGFDLTRLVQTTSGERYWFIGDEHLAAASETQPWRWRWGSGRGCPGMRDWEPVATFDE